MQAAMDSTALMLSSDLTQGLITPSQINTKAQAYFAALFTSKAAKSVSISATYTPGTSSTDSAIPIPGSVNVSPSTSVRVTPGMVSRAGPNTGTGQRASRARLPPT